ncbi:MoaD/ThiS family protein [Nocardioides hungaricus]
MTGRRATVTVRYWGAIKALTGVAEETVVGATLADVLAEIAVRHPDRRFTALLEICSILVGDRRQDRGSARQLHLVNRDVVELLPPFAGG